MPTLGGERPFAFQRKAFHCQPSPPGRGEKCSFFVETSCHSSAPEGGALFIVIFGHAWE
jgi:hypothetical protein